MNSRKTLSFLGLLLFATVLKSAPVTGGTTTLALDTTNLSILSNYFTFNVVPPTTITVVNNVPTATFPIIGGDTSTGIFDHSGGLALTGTAATTNPGVTGILQNFVANLGTSTLTAEAVTTGLPTIENFPAFNIGPAGVLTVSSALAQFYTNEYGLPDLTNRTFGTVTISPAVGTAPEPSTFAMMAGVLLAVPFANRLRNKK